uniref:Putative nickel insertion protein n=1 Tax=Magnetococcus massalia (strain MO-1) TaxID=451514 RepID=A0A1S7LGL8_MAGMO|nr:Conserved protein of unknown function [Candidatus Magnetococcus massalia]
MRLHLDLSAGIAGDMFMAAMLDLGADREALELALRTLPLPDWSLKIIESTNGGLRGLHVTVDYPHEHRHRHLADIRQIITGSELAESVQQRALGIFTALAEAEGAVHGISAEKVHFHEVGAVDAIIDICAAAWLLDHLGITQVTASPLMPGSGSVRCAHGEMSVPVPAVSELVKRHGIPLQAAAEPGMGELATPTGVAILSQLVGSYGVNSLSTIDLEGAGLGTKELPGRANRLRIFAQQTTDAAISEMVQEEVVTLIAHIDDMNPEWMGSLWDALFKAGAWDVAVIPAQMKKGRMGSRLEVMAEPEKEQVLAALILKQTTSLGVRVQRASRWILPRELKQEETPWGGMRVKWAGGVPRLEHDDLARIAEGQGWGLPEAQWRVIQWLAEAPKRG